MQLAHHTPLICYIITDLKYESPRNKWQSVRSSIKTKTNFHQIDVDNSITHNIQAAGYIVVLN